MRTTYFTEIRFTELSAFHAAFFKKIDVENLPYVEAVYSLMDGLDTSEKLVYARKQLNDICRQVQMANLFWALRMDALNALMRLQSYSVTDKDILNIHDL